MATRKDTAGRTPLEELMPALQINPSNASTKSPAKTPSFKVPDIIKSPSGARYKVLKKLGHGASGTCYKVTEMVTGKEFAAKIVLKSTLISDLHREKLKSEQEIHLPLKHKYVAEFIESFETEDAVFMILELCKYGTLFEMVATRTRLTVPEVQYFGLQLIEGLMHLHDECLVLHRDIKLANLMIGENMTLKFVDFGFAAKLEFSGQKRITKVGTPNYLSPEIINGNFTGGHSHEADIWSFGVVMYMLLIGVAPFETESRRETYDRIQNVVFDYPPDIDVPSSFQDLIDGIFQRNPEDRLTLSQIRCHSFFRSPIPPTKMPLTALTSVPTEFAPISADPCLMSPGQPQAQDSKKFGVPVSLALPSDGILKEVHSRLAYCVARNKDIFINMGSENFGVVPRSISEVESSKMLAISSNLLVSVLKHVELPKFGTGFLLSSGVLGVLFNDLTAIFGPLEGAHFHYVERNQAVMYPLTVGNYPASLSKKVFLFTGAFKKDLLKMFEDQAQLPKPGRALLAGTGTMNDYDWVFTRHKDDAAVLFRLSGGAIQIRFNDQTDLAFSCATQVFRYVNKHGVREVMTLDDAMDKNRADIYKRLEYASRFLRGLIDNKTTPRV